MSSGSESDEDFVPGEPEQLSEEESADEETDLQFENELKQKTTKRKVKSVNNKSKKRQKTTRSTKEEEIEEEEKVEDVIADPVQEKKREDDLWAMFLEGTDTKPKAATKDNIVTKVPLKASGSVANEIKTPVASLCNDKKEDDAKSKERRIFEFAGETIVVEDNVIKEKLKTTDKSTVAAASKPAGPSFKGRGSGGLSNILGQLNKTNKLSTLEKSKLDWQTYKKEEDVEEEIQTINKGKAGYLDRQDFLERADMRQYELEREMRMSRRSNR